MADDFRVLLRLASAQLALARLKEAQMNAERQSLSDLRCERSEIRAVMERLDPGIKVHSVTARRLSGLDSAIDRSERRLEEMTRDAIKANSRYEGLVGRAGAVRSRQLRTDAEIEAQEVVQAMGRRAPHKDSVMD